MMTQVGIGKDFCSQQETLLFTAKIARHFS